MSNLMPNYQSTIALSSLSNILRDFDLAVSGSYDTPRHSGPRTLHGRADYDKGAKTYFYEVALPGYAREEVTVSIEDSTLTVSASSKTRGDASLVLTLDQIDEDKIAAKLEHGILRITLPPVAKPAAKRVAIS